MKKPKHTITAPARRARAESPSAFAALEQFLAQVTQPDLWGQVELHDPHLADALDALDDALFAAAPFIAPEAPLDALEDAARAYGVACMESAILYGLYVGAALRGRGLGAEALCFTARDQLLTRAGLIHPDGTPRRRSEIRGEPRPDLDALEGFLERLTRPDFWAGVAARDPHLEGDLEAVRRALGELPAQIPAGLRDDLEAAAWGYGAACARPGLLYGVHLGAALRARAAGTRFLSDSALYRLFARAKEAAIGAS